MSEKSRTSRETETREAEEPQFRPADRWVPQGKLPKVPHEEGWRFRFIATKVLGESQNMNVSAKFREGWVPCKIEDYPDMISMPDIDATMEGNIECGGLLLCKMPEELARQRDAYYAGKTEEQNTAVEESYFRENDPRTQKFADNKSRTTFGSQDR